MAKFIYVGGSVTHETCGRTLYLHMNKVVELTEEEFDGLPASERSKFKRYPAAKSKPALPVEKAGSAPPPPVHVPEDVEAEAEAEGEAEAPRKEAGEGPPMRKKVRRRRP